VTGSGESLRPALLLLATVRLVVNTAHRLTSPFLPVIARGLGIPLEQAGALVAVRSAAAMATPVIVTANRKRQRRHVLQLGLVMFVIGAGVTAASNVFVGALIGFATMGLAKAVFDVSGQAYLSDRTPYSERARYLALFEITWAGAFLIGAPIAGQIISRWGWQAAFWVTGTLVALVVIVSPRVFEEDGSEDGERGRLTLNRSSLGLMVAAGAFSAASESVAVVLGAWLEDAFAVALGAIAGLTAIIGLFELSGSSMTALITDRIGKRRAVIIGLVVSTVGYLGMGIAQNHLVAGIAMTAVAFAGFEFTVVSTFPLASEVASHARARYLAWLVVAINAGRTVAAFAGTRFFVSFGFGANIGAAVALNVAAVGVMLWLVVDVDEVRQAGAISAD